MSNKREILRTLRKQHAALQEGLTIINRRMKSDKKSAEHLKRELAKVKRWIAWSSGQV